MTAPFVLCVAGSPRRHGNTEKLLDACMHGVKAAGGEVGKLIPSEEHIWPCQGCNACSMTGQCVLRDASAEIYERFDAADAIVIATPIYFATVPAMLKILVDRMQPYWARHYVLKEPLPATRPGGILVAGAGAENPYGMECAVKPLRSVLGVLGVEVIDVLEVSGVDSPSDIGRHPDALDRAQALGVAVTRAARDAAAKQATEGAVGE